MLMLSLINFQRLSPARPAVLEGNSAFPIMMWELAKCGNKDRENAVLCLNISGPVACFRIFKVLTEKSHRIEAWRLRRMLCSGL